MVWLLHQAAGEHRVPAPWSIVQIHDTVAKIAAQPRYAASIRQSLIGRFIRYVLQRIAELLAFFRGSLDARIVVVATIVLVTAVIVARVVIAARLREEQRGRSVFHTKGGARLDWWTIARDEAANGRYAEASHAVYAAVIDTFVRQGLMAFHASKTSGDYARDLRRAGGGAPFVASFRAFARQFDRIVFGTTVVTADDYVRLRELAERAARAQEGGRP